MLHEYVSSIRTKYLYSTGIIPGRISQYIYIIIRQGFPYGLLTRYPGVAVNKLRVGPSECARSGGGASICYMAPTADTVERLLVEECSRERTLSALEQLVYNRAVP